MSIEPNLLDQQLLAAAAAAAGDVARDRSRSETLVAKRVAAAISTAGWNPLADTNQALDLAAALGMTIKVGETSIVVSDGKCSCEGPVSQDPAGTLCRNIVRVAAGV